MSTTMQTGTPAAIPSFAMRMLALCYGGLAYLIFLATFLYAIGFVSRLVVPKTINTGPTASLVDSLADQPGAHVDLRRAAQRDGAAGFQEAVRALRLTGDRALTYVLLASLSLILLFWQWQPMPAVVWNIEGPVFAGVVTAIGFMGWLIVLYSTFLISHFELFGLTQVVAHFAGRMAEPVRFRTPGLYRLIRHPIYLGFIIAFWSTPVMTLGHLLFASVTTAYIFVGIWLEERDLVAFFGEEYRKYRERVAMLLPGLF